MIPKADISLLPFIFTQRNREDYITIAFSSPIDTLISSYLPPAFVFLHDPAQSP